MPIEIIAFDADDTLWKNEILYQNALAELREILSPWEIPEKINEIVNEVEHRNMKQYGYGIKAFILSLIEAALQISDHEIHAMEIKKILAIGRSMLEADIYMMPNVLETLKTLQGKYPMMVITKGDLLDQTTKVKRSGLEEFFVAVEVVNEKTEGTYLKILETHQIDPQGLLMVGNSIRSDILPILNIGGKAVYIPADSTWSHEMVPDFNPEVDGFYELTHIGQLPDLLQKV